MIDLIFTAKLHLFFFPVYLQEGETSSSGLSLFMPDPDPPVYGKEEEDYLQNISPINSIPSPIPVENGGDVARPPPPPPPPVSQLIP